jgi:hypothetical protein
MALQGYIGKHYSSIWHATLTSGVTPKLGGGVLNLGSPIVTSGGLLMH